MPSFEINGIPLEYTLEGQPEPAETVVLIHGELASTEFWDATVSELASKYRIILRVESHAAKQPVKRTHSRSWRCSSIWASAVTIWLVIPVAA
jgi:hypothetical protein